MKFSIGIPAYKATFLSKCIDSVLKQTFRDFELIIVNDASPENIEEIINNFSDKRIKYYKNEKKTGSENVVKNWNKCLECASGEYFVLLGDDDLIESDYLYEFDKLIQKFPICDVFHCRTKIIDEESNFIMLSESRPEFETVYESIWHRISGKRMQFISDFIYRRESLISNGGFYEVPLAWASDDITAYIASEKNGIANTNKPLFNYRRNSQTISSNGSLELKLKAIDREREWLEEFIVTKEPTYEIDKYLIKMIKEHLVYYISKKNVYTLSTNLKQIKIFHIRYWRSVFKCYNISNLMVIYAIAICIKNKLR